MLQLLQSLVAVQLARVKVPICAAVAYDNSQFPDPPVHSFFPCPQKQGQDPRLWISQCDSLDLQSLGPAFSLCTLAGGGAYRWCLWRDFELPLRTLLNASILSSSHHPPRAGSCAPAAQPPKQAEDEE